MRISDFRWKQVFFEKMWELELTPRQRTPSPCFLETVLPGAHHA